MDDLNYKWKQNIDITPLWKLINELHPDIQFIFENLSSKVNFLDVKCTIDNNQIMFDIYHKPIHSLSYLHYKSCHPRHTRDNIALSLGQRIVRLVSEDRQLRLQQLKSELIKRGHPAKIIDDTFSKLLTPVRDRSSTTLESIPFIYTYNPGTKFNKNKITKCLENVESNKLVQAFWNKRPFVSTRRSDNLQKILTRSKFNMSLVKHIPEKFVGLFNCSDNRCMLHNNG